MGKISVLETPIQGIWVLKTEVYNDARGFFMEVFNKKEFENVGLKLEFVQINYSRSKKGVLRGLHFQKWHPQGKLVKVLRGTIYDVAVDLRPNSKSFGKWYGTIISEENGKMIYIPEGFAHGFLALEDSDVIYGVTDYYHPEDEGGIIWNDPDISIKWPLKDIGMSYPILSDKDLHWPKFADQTFEYYINI